MSATRSCATITQIEEGLVEQERLLEHEQHYEGPIIKTTAQIHTEPSSATTTMSNATPATTASITTTNTRTTATTSRTTSGPTSGTHQQGTSTGGKLPDNVTNDLDDPDSYKKHGLCGSSRCMSHWVCKDPLLYRRSLYDR